ncbi:MAG: CHAT domain-containing tetratricopeptide repeat protein [Spirulinaceae cyanobacterium]
MAALTCALPDKQIFLKIYGTLTDPSLMVEVQVFRQGDRNQLIDSRVQTVAVLPDLAQQTQDHWQGAYRPLFPGRMLKPKSISLGQVSLQSCRQSAQTLVVQMHDWLSGADWQPIRETLLRVLNPEDQIQLVIQSCDRTIQQLPWCQWQLLQTYPQAVVTQSTLDAQPLPPRPARARMRILGILGASDHIGTDLDRQLLEALPPEQVEVQILDQPNRAALTDQLWEQPWDMILFAGHGTTTDDGQGLLYLNDQSETLSLNDIWYGLRKAVQAGLQLAIFNSCAGLGLLARNLRDDAQIPQMIVMRDVVPDIVAQTFLRHLLEAFAVGIPLYQAATRARERLQGLEGEYPCASWLPIIWQNPYATSFQLAPEPQSDPIPNRSTAQIQPFWRRRRAMVALGTMVAGMIAAWGLRSPAAQWLNKQGNLAYEQQEMLVAERYFRRAAFLDRRYPHPRYGLAWLYDEVWGEPEAALQWYKEAALLEFPEAIAQYIRLELLNTDTLTFADASRFLKLSQHCLEKTTYAGTTASCLKNRGWIRVLQQRWTKAEIDLREAIELHPEAPHSHCLLAQTLEAKDQPQAALKHWRKTLEYSAEHIPEQDVCLESAEERLGV